MALQSSPAILIPPLSSSKSTTTSKYRLQVMRALILTLILSGLLVQLLWSMSDPLTRSSSSHHEQAPQFPPPVARIKRRPTIYPRNETCTSPEYASVPWPWGTGGDAPSHLSNFTCGFPKTMNDKDKNRHDSSSLSSLFVYLQQVTIPFLEQAFAQECRRLVVYGAALGAKYLDDKSKEDPFEYHKHHGRCFFLFVLEEDIPPVEQNELSVNLTMEQGIPLVQHNDSSSSSAAAPLTMNGQFWLVPLPRHVLPYTSMRRNTKLLKYTGQYIFPFVQERIVWQDAKFRFFLWKKTPANYHGAINVVPATTTSGRSRPQEEPCIQAMGLPPHESSFGKVAKTINYRPRYRDHCTTIINALKQRPTVTDMPVEVTERLCQSYETKVEASHQPNLPPQNTTDMPLNLDLGLIDSAFLVYNVAHPKCRDWNAEFHCSLLDELHCHADRDQLSIPYVLHRMGLSVKVLGTFMPNEGHPQQMYTPFHHLQLVLPSSSDNDDDNHDNQISSADRHPSSSSNPPMVFITRSGCHWYYARLSDCDRSPKPVALQPKATTATITLPQQRLANEPMLAVLVTGTTKRFLLNSTVEHVLRPLTAYGETRYKVDYYALLTETAGQAYRQDLEYMNHIVGDPLFYGDKNLSSVASGVIGESGATLQAFLVLPEALPVDEKVLGGADFDALRFPTFDSRNPNRTAAGNRNMVKLFNHQQYLWDTQLRRVEELHGAYDYIMIIRDDALWIQDFDLTKLLESNPDADAYVQACDRRKPPLHPREIIDHGIVIKRKKADVVGRYLSSLASTDRLGCDYRSGLLPQRGCNSEMLLKWILEQHQIKVELVPQSLLPFERSLAVQTTNGTMQYCFHKLCQSHKAPLIIPKNLKPCVELNFH